MFWLTYAPVCPDPPGTGWIWHEPSQKYYYKVNSYLGSWNSAKSSCPTDMKLAEWRTQEEFDAVVLYAGIKDITKI